MFLIIDKIKESTVGLNQLFSIITAVFFPTMCIYKYGNITILWHTINLIAVMTYFKFKFKTEILLINNYQY